MRVVAISNSTKNSDCARILQPGRRRRPPDGIKVITSTISTYPAKKPTNNLSQKSEAKKPNGENGEMCAESAAGTGWTRAKNSRLTSGCLSAGATSELS